MSVRDGWSGKRIGSRGVRGVKNLEFFEKIFLLVEERGGLGKCWKIRRER